MSKQLLVPKYRPPPPIRPTDDTVRIPASQPEELLRALGTLLEELKIISLSLYTPDDAFKREKETFIQRRAELLKDPRFAGKFVAIVNGEIAGAGYDKIKLAREVYNKRGSVTMFIGEVSQEDRVAEEPSFEVEST